MVPAYLIAYDRTRTASGWPTNVTWKVSVVPGPQLLEQHLPLGKLARKQGGPGDKAVPEARFPRGESSPVARLYRRRGCAKGEGGLEARLSGCEAALL